MLDDELVIETPERVELHYVLANVGNRFLAAALDHLIQAVLILLLLLVGFLAGGVESVSGLSSDGTMAAAVVVLGFFSIYWGYFVVFETLWNGQTPGKRIMRLRVVREDGRPVRFFEVFVRNVLRVALDMQPAFSYAIGVVSIIFSARSKRIGDFVAGTVVVKERATEAPALEEIIKLAEFDERRVKSALTSPFNADTRILTDRELKAVETFLKRRYELPEPNRSEVATRIAQSLSAKLGVSSEHLPPELILEEIERQHQVKSRYVD
jgi:uncharacterized RDD family membrane protein YckC